MHTKKYDYLFKSYKLIVNKYCNYINGQRLNKTDFALSNKNVSSPFARCFAIFGRYNFSTQLWTEGEKDILAFYILKDLKLFINQKYNLKDFYNYKAPSQLLTFSLTALYCLDRVNDNKKFLRSIIEPYLIIDIKKYFIEHKVLTAEPTSGNFAMFLAIILIYARDWLNIDTQEKINYWTKSHLKNLNNLNLWGNNDFYAQFQSGYHQYEIFDYLKINIFDNKKIIRNIIKIQDFEGHYGPFPGGGGCYDFDAIRLLTLSQCDEINTHKSIYNFVKSLIKEQNKNGGFSESYDFYPLRIKSQIRYFIKILSLKNIDNIVPLAKQYFYIILRNPIFNNNHFCIHTNKKWSESDLWNSWFRVLSLTNSLLFLNRKESLDSYKKIKFPGIGYSK